MHSRAREAACENVIPKLDSGTFFKILRSPFDKIKGSSVKSHLRKATLYRLWLLNSPLYSEQLCLPLSFVFVVGGSAVDKRYKGTDEKRAYSTKIELQGAFVAK